MKPIPGKKETRILQDAFRDGTSGCVRICACDRTHFDICEGNGWDWEEGELEKLKQAADTEPDRFIESNGAVTAMTIDGCEFVMNCPCGYAAAAEQFIRKNAPSIKRYLTAWAKELKTKAEAINPE